MFKSLFGRKNKYTEDEWYDEKSARMVKALGEEHDQVMHAIISYEVGGALHGYFYPHGIPGTGLATKQLARLNDGSSNRLYRKYEFVMFSRRDLVKAMENFSVDQDDPTYFQLRSALNSIAPYSEEATLNPFETVGFPDDWEHMGGRQFIFDSYKPECFDKEFGLMLVIEIFPSELEYKTENGGDALLEKLRAAGHYPYSDMDREPVI